MYTNDKPVMELEVITHTPDEQTKEELNNLINKVSQEPKVIEVFRTAN